MKLQIFSRTLEISQDIFFNTEKFFPSIYVLEKRKENYILQWDPTYICEKNVDVWKRIQTKVLRVLRVMEESLWEWVGGPEKREGGTALMDGRECFCSNWNVLISLKGE